MNFEQAKQDTINRPDNSKKGSWDERIIPFCELLNKHPDYFTTSSCSGRISLTERNEEKKQETNWVYITHNLASTNEVTDSLNQYGAGGRVYFMQEPFILHVCARTLECAQRIIDVANENGCKKAHIIATRKRFVVELQGTQTLTVPVFENWKLVGDDYLSSVVKIANEKLERNWKVIDRLSQAFSNDVQK